MISLNMPSIVVLPRRKTFGFYWHVGHSRVNENRRKEWCDFDRSRLVPNINAS